MDLLLKVAFCMVLALTFERCTSMATNKPPRKGYRVCTSSPCNSNGSELFLVALESLATEDMTIKEDYCLGGCCAGIVVKPIALNARRRTMPVIADEELALEKAQALLLEVEGLDESKWDNLMAKREAGQRALENTQDPDICKNCGVGLQLYRGNCAKCGKSPY